ncbi:MaoC family dehydratase [Streptosporangium subroseum]|jgi:acyl dehydratase|uniref:Acyl dehydratase n=1 Tax=Streptosporangium subroseum TaxID=106412 RepID=A0A239LYV0_9ACTN|nr:MULTISPECIES: MaoC family dehydratase [Streptosporangium]AWS40251.1 dehydratase [Streptosporangium sp. 'caverna']WSA16492.1 MaoC family dehydratase [Streptosporangium subroseum]SNT35651.1 Acyl dehydratase [Streptosporangium subroseum]
MAATVRYDEVETGQQIPAAEYPVRRANLVMYAGASGDFNPIHWNERFAKTVGLPDVIAHGMFTMAQGGRFVTDWAGDPGAVIDYGVRFSSMVVVPDDDQGTVITVSGVIEEKLEDKRVVVALTAKANDSRVLSKARAVVQLS